jgi:hypothetical protein
MISSVPTGRDEIEREQEEAKRILADGAASRSARIDRLSRPAGLMRARTWILRRRARSWLRRTFSTESGRRGKRTP